MADKKEPSEAAIWLGLADNTFTRQKTVKFGDASAVNSGRFYSILIVCGLIMLWVLSSRLGLVKEFYWPTIGGTIDRVILLVTEGFRNISLWEHVGISVFRVLTGVLCGAIVGIPLGFAMGLSSTARGLFDPIVEFMRPIPPLALIPLIILWFGIDETAKIFLLFLASLFIMTIAARSGVSSVRISKVHAAYSLGASKLQILRHVILPNALPEIFTGLRTSMGGVLGHCGCSRTCCGRQRSRLDDHDCQELPADRYGRDRHHHHWYYRLCHRDHHAVSRKVADPLEGQGLIPHANQ